MSTYQTEQLSEEKAFGPKKIADGLYTSESYTADGEKIELYMELLTEDNIDDWNKYRNRASSIVSAIPHQSKQRVLREVPRGAGAVGYSIGEYVVYAIKPETRDLLFTLVSTDDTPDSIEDFKKDYENILMTVYSQITPKQNCFGWWMNKESYTNRGIFRNPLSIIDGKHKGLAMLLHGFSAAVAQDFFEKQFMEVSPIASMQGILFHSLPREAFFNMNHEDYEKIKEASQSMTGQELVNNVIKIEFLSALYYQLSHQNANKAQKLLLENIEEIQTNVYPHKSK